MEKWNKMRIVSIIAVVMAMLSLACAAIAADMPES